MKIAVYSPTRREGATTVSVLLAVALARVARLKTCVTYTGHGDEAFNTFLGIDNDSDLTKSLNQMLRMIEAGVLDGEGMEDYLTKVEKNLDIMHTKDKSIDAAGSNKLLNYTQERLDHNIIITDINEEPYDESTVKILNEADLIVVVVSQSIDVLNRFKIWRDSDYFPDPAKVVYMVNRFDANVSATRVVSNYIGIKYNKVCKLNQNGYIRKMSNDGNLIGLMTYILNKDERVLELNTDLRELVHLVSGNLGFKIDWR